MNDILTLIYIVVQRPNGWFLPKMEIHGACYSLHFFSLSNSKAVQVEFESPEDKIGEICFYNVPISLVFDEKEVSKVDKVHVELPLRRKRHGTHLLRFLMDQMGRDFLVPTASGTAALNFFRFVGFAFNLQDVLEYPPTKPGWVAKHLLLSNLWFDILDPRLGIDKHCVRLREKVSSLVFLCVFFVCPVFLSVEIYRHVEASRNTRNRAAFFGKTSSEGCAPTIHWGRMFELKVMGQVVCDCCWR